MFGLQAEQRPHPGAGTSRPAQGEETFASARAGEGLVRRGTPSSGPSARPGAAARKGAKAEGEERRQKVAAQTGTARGQVRQSKVQIRTGRG